MIRLSRTVAAWTLALTAIFGAIAATGQTSPSKTSATPVTFNHDIAPIVFRYCSACHHPGEAGPFPLLSYDDAKKHAQQIVSVVRQGFMPPWLPEPGAPHFQDELRLSPRQITLLEQWVKQGAVEGNPADLPAAPQFPDGWYLGKPDLILTATKPYTLPPSGTDRYWNFVLRLPIDDTRWLKAIEIRPGDKRLVHHANILVDRTQWARHHEEAPGAGFAGMELRMESETFDPDSHFLFWKPGTVPYVEPDGMALRLNPGDDLVLNTHLQPSGKPEQIQPAVGLYFTDKPATRHPMLMQLENDEKLDIPPGVSDFVVTDSFTLPVGVDVLAVYPHAHYLGCDLLGTATLPDGTRKTLIHIKHWDLNWQAVYRYTHPISLPPGSKVSMRYVYDNSSANLANPNHPPQRVRGGNRAVDEMAHLWLQVLPHHGTGTESDARRALQEGLARHNVQKDPGNFEAHYNLGAMLQARGRLADATSQYEMALRVRPDDAVANNALGGALLATGNVPLAVSHFARALKGRPDYFDAHYNLGNALASEGDFAGAVEQFQAAVNLNPEDADAEANLGSALAETGQVAQAKLHFRRALRLNPNHELARQNLEAIEQDPNAR